MASLPLPPNANLQTQLSFSKPTQTLSPNFHENHKSFQLSYKSHCHQISSLCKQGQIQEAVDLFTKMELENLQVQPEIYGELLQGCVYARDLSTGQQIHARIIKNGEFLAGNEYIETKLVIFYSKCDAYSVASRMFRMVSSKNVFSWAAIIGMNCRMGFCEEALLGLLEMLDSGYLPDNFVVPNALKACGALQWIGVGKGIHGYAIKMGYGTCVFVSSSLVDMYGKCGAMEDARMVFDGIPEKNVVTWNSLMVGYVLNGENEEAIKLFYNLRMESVKPTQVTISSYLSASANIGAPDEGKQGHSIAVVEGLVLTAILGSSIINFYSKVGLIEDAELVFSQMAEKDAVTWNLIISGYVQVGKIDKALSMCRRMRSEKLRFDSVTLASLMSASADTSNLKLGKEGHCYCIRNNLDSDVVVASSIVDMYAKCKRIDCARGVFDSVTNADLVLWNTMLAAYAELGQSGETLKLFYKMQLESVPPSVISWNSIILGFLKNGQIDEAKDMFLQMQSLGIQPNLVTWTTLISGLAENGFGFEAIFAFQKMQEAGIRPNSLTIVSVLSSCIDMALLQYGKAIHGYVTRHVLSCSVPLATSLVDMYAKCGNIDKAKRLFDMIEEKAVPTYNAMISGYALHGQAVEALALYKRLEEEALSVPRNSAMLTLNGTNHKQWVESLMLNLTLMRVDLALRMDAPPKPADDATEKDKKSYEDWEHSNRCCLMLMRYHMDESIRDSIPQIENAKDFLAAIKEKYKKFSKNEKNECLTLFHRTNYADTGDIRAHIDKLMGCYQKLKGMGLDLGEDYMVWFVMETIPSQFDSIRSSYNAQKEQWTIEEMTAILAKEEEDMKKGRARSISMVTNPNNSHKRKFTPNNSSDQRFHKKRATNPKGNGQASSSSTGHKNEFFKGKCNFCQCFGHKKADCRKLKAHLEKKGSDKSKKAE